MRRPPVMDKLVAAARDVLAAGRSTLRISVPADMVDDLPAGKVVGRHGDRASIDLDAELLVKCAGPDA